MRIPSFSVTNQRSIRLAACEQPPRVMVVTGPNGCGKSTLLNALRGAGGSGPILYVGPHRTSRRQKVQARYLYQKPIRMNQLLSSTSLPGFEGINIPNRNRDAWDFDEVSSYLKFGLCQVELDRQSAIAHRLDKTGEIAKDSIPDVWSPLKEMTSNLLPHLSFERIDISNRDQVQCLWHVHSRDITIDIDELSSGEKAVVQLFFPFIENQVHLLLDQVKGEESSAEPENVCVLMDEPELHLHPVVQGKILEYIRTISSRDGVQFIIATQSQVIVEYANSDELYLLRPSELVGEDRNQLVQIADNEERLTLLRDVFGSTSNITAMRPIVIVEGRRESNDAVVARDSRIYAFLSERFNQITILPGGGKTECARLASSLTTLMKDYSSKLSAYALLDRDLDVNDPEDPALIYLPVSMIENLLVDPKVIFDATVTVRHKTTFSSVNNVDVALDRVMDSLRDHEIGRRVKSAIGAHTFRLSDPIDAAGAQVESFSRELGERAGAGAVAVARSQAEQEVSRLESESLRREHFDGKQILSEFFRAHLHHTGMSKEIFIYECARVAAGRASVQRFVQEFFGRVSVVDPQD